MEADGGHPERAGVVMLCCDGYISKTPTTAALSAQAREHQSVGGRPCVCVSWSVTNDQHTCSISRRAVGVEEQELRTRGGEEERRSGGGGERG